VVAVLHLPRRPQPAAAAHQERQRWPGRARSAALPTDDRLARVARARLRTPHPSAPSAPADPAAAASMRVVPAAVTESAAPSLDARAPSAAQQARTATLARSPIEVSREPCGARAATRRPRDRRARWPLAERDTAGTPNQQDDDSEEQSSPGRTLPACPATGAYTGSLTLQGASSPHMDGGHDGATQTGAVRLGGAGRVRRRHARARDR